MYCDEAEHLQECCNDYNSGVGTLTGYDCKLCNNRGDYLRVRDGYIVTAFCECLKMRKTLRQIEQSGIAPLIEDCTFDNYETAQAWQKHLFNRARAFVDDCEGNWFYIGGQVGCGKTHLCTAIVGELLRRGNEAKYMLWRDEVVMLKAIVNDGEPYKKAMSEYKNVRVLYIDDFFKTEDGNLPTVGDMNVAFELINYRYMNSELITIISSEMPISNVIKVSEALGSRIYHRAKKYSLEIERGEAKNYRLR